VDNNKNILTFTAALMLMSSFAVVAETKQEAKSQARDALAKKEDDSDSQKALEEVFEAAENNYTLLKKGGTSLNYGFSYSYFGDQSLFLDVDNGQVRALSVRQSANHTFTNSFTFDYGLMNNVTLSATLPLVAKFDTTEDLTSYAMGDMGLSMRWQPWAAVPGELNKTLFMNFNTATGESPYDIIIGEELSTGSGGYSFGFGGSVSKVLDPVVLFGSLSYTHNFNIEELSQVRSGRILEAVEPGDSISLSGGFAYSLSYDVSLTTSIQASYSDSSVFDFKDTVTTLATTSEDENGDPVIETKNIINDNTVETGKSFSGVMNMALGIRVSPTTIVNVNTGFGLTEDSPDMVLGFSMPLDISGLKDFSQN
jgi:hypothetical protein